MKRFLNLIFLLIMASLVLSLSGCGGHNSSLYERLNNNNNNNSDSDSNSDSNSGTNNNTNNNSTGSGGMSATITEDSDGTININLSNSSSISAADEKILEVQEYIWHIDADNEEYWTSPSGTKMDEDEVLEAIEAAGKSYNGIYIARDIRYVPDTLNFSETKVAKESGGQDSCYVAYYNESLAGDSKHILAALPTEYNGQQNASLETVKAAMTHSASEAAKYPVLHITRPGKYSLKGEWQGQIWIDIPDGANTDTEDNENAQVLLTLDNINVNCGVAPALVFKKVYECGPDDSSEVASTMTSDAYAIGEEVASSAGAVVLLKSGTTNTFTGTNVARMNKLKLNDDDYSESQIGQYVKAQKKLYKLDAAFHSRQSLRIDGTGTLIISSDYEGLDSELHMMIENGNITVTANDDGINVNEDDISVFTMIGGTLTVTSNYGDGIDSNGYASFKNCTLNITAGNQEEAAAGEAGIDAEKTVTIDESVTYTWNASGNSNGGGGFGGPGGGTPPDGNGPGGNPPSGGPALN